MGKGWTQERRDAQAARCRANKPWQHSTGPKTARGKARSSINALKHGGRSQCWDHLRHSLRLHKEFLDYYDAFSRELYANKLKKALIKESKINRLNNLEKKESRTK